MRLTYGGCRVIALLLSPLGAAHAQQQPRDSGSGSPIPEYQRLAGQFNALIAQTTAPKKIQDALEGALRGDLQEQPGGGIRPTGYEFTTKLSQRLHFQVELK